MKYEETGIQPVKSERSAVVETTTTRQIEEVKAMIFMAKQFPRNQNEALGRLLHACENPRLAEEATYEYARGGSKAKGASIRLAEEAARAWGNMEFGTVVLEQTPTKTTLQAYAWDVESNLRQSRTFEVPHVRETRKGNYALTGPRDIYEIVANMGARRVRACILGLIPGYIIDEALEVCESTLTKSLGGNLDEAIANMVKAFHSEFKVKKKDIEELIGCKAEAFTANDMSRLRGIYASIKDGMSAVEDHFGGKKAPEKPSPIDELTQADVDEINEGMGMFGGY